MDNAFIGAFKGRFRAECLNAHGFLTLAAALIDKSRQRYQPAAVTKEAKL